MPFRLDYRPPTHALLILMPTLFVRHAARCYAPRDAFTPASAYGAERVRASADGVKRASSAECVMRALRGWRKGKQR